MAEESVVVKPQPAKEGQEQGQPWWRRVPWWLWIAAAVIIGCALWALWPKGVQQPRPAVAVGQAAWTAVQAKQLYKLGDDVVLTPDPGEKDCFIATPKAGGSFEVTNPFSGWVDGYRASPGELRPGYSDAKTGLPPGKTVRAEKATLRPRP